MVYASRNKGTIKGVEKNMGKNKQVGGIINPIQPMYNPTAADMQRQQGMMDAQQTQRASPQGTPNKEKDMPTTKGMAEGGALKEPPSNIPSAFFSSCIGLSVTPLGAACA